MSTAVPQPPRTKLSDVVKIWMIYPPKYVIIPPDADGVPVTEAVLSPVAEPYKLFAVNEQTPDPAVIMLAIAFFINCFIALLCAGLTNELSSAVFLFFYVP